MASITSPHQNLQFNQGNITNQNQYGKGSLIVISNLEKNIHQ